MLAPSVLSAWEVLKLAKKYLLSFLGGTDLKNADKIDEDPSALIQTVNYLKPDVLIIFLTQEMKENYKNSNLKNNIIKLFPKINIEEIELDITDPTNTEAIYKSIYPEIKLISQKIVQEKTQGFVNLTSGTPQIISVLSLLLITKILDRSHGLYAPNPKYGGEVKVDKLEFFRTSIGLETIKALISQYDYAGILNILKNDYYRSKVESDPELINILNFSKSLFMADFKQSEECYLKSQTLKEILPDLTLKNNLDYCCQRFYTLKPLFNNHEYAQATIWTAIIRETTIEYLLEKLMPGSLDAIAFRESKDRPWVLSEEKIDLNLPELKEYLKNCWNDSKTTTNQRDFDFNRELTHQVSKWILDFIGERFIENKKIWNKLKSSIYGLDQPVKNRNLLAHEIEYFEYDKTWLTHTERMLQKTLELSKSNSQLLKDPYDLLNIELFKRFETVFSS